MRREGAPTRTPEVGRRYVLARARGGHVERVEYTRFVDGSVSIVTREYEACIDSDPPAPDRWAAEWAALVADGFAEPGPDA